MTEFPEVVSRIDSEEELTILLKRYGLPGPYVGLADDQAAIQAHVDATAKSKGYNDAASLAGYVASAVEPWAAEATTFIAWRDAVWVYVYQQLALVQAQQRPQPSPAELVGELPVVEWPA